MSGACAALCVWLVAVAPVPARKPTPETRPVPANGVSGRWELVVPACEFATGRKPPRGRTDTIVDAGGWVDVRSRSLRAEGDSLALDYRYRTDGEATNKVMGQDVVTRGKHDGAALMFESVAKVLLLELKVRERWSLPHADTLVMVRDTDSPMGKEHQRLVFARRR